MLHHLHHQVIILEGMHCPHAKTSFHAIGRNWVVFPINRDGFVYIVGFESNCHPEHSGVPKVMQKDGYCMVKLYLMYCFASI